ncbi:hypothetical protein SCUCBS95973_007404 [Sporothrix curviconia]|uniref:Protein kinase domain-containing protein n=1 Tax=Sporothrix curviconia TaxID=1260050 RepID=A0ABP0CD15_9PEZI
MDQPLPRISAEDFDARITTAMDTMLQHGGVIHDDPKMENILLADDGHIMFIDLESVMEPDAGREARIRELAIGIFTVNYKYHLKIRKEMEARGEVDMW